MSGHQGALSRQLHDKLDFGLVVNCTNDVPFLSPRRESTKYIKVPINDNLKKKEIDKFYKFISDTVQLMCDCIAKGDKVLVHCHAGRQRSATIVACWLMKERRIPYREAVILVQSANVHAFTPCVNFEPVLARYEEHLRRFGESSATFL